ncbi:MAG TPA: hypothetical protein VMQ59_02220 [Acidimicrobiales bacterium]|nr:hypothetical protein [Acidimicrobiales bacterium]
MGDDRDGQHSTPTGVVVLGMHRSGTSATTGLISLLGLSTCIPEDLLHGTSTNAKGHWESRSLIAFNEKLLAQMGRKWWYPPSIDQLREWEASPSSMPLIEARAVFDHAHPVEPWVWKDPRTCLTLAYWRHALDRPVAGIIVYRKPLEVAGSLKRRDYMSSQFGVALWERYNRVLLKQAGGMPVLVTPYEDLLRDPAGWSETVREFLTGLGMAVHPVVDTKMVDRFVDPKLNHGADGPDDLGAGIGDSSSAKLYGALRDLEGIHPSFVAPVLGDEPSWVGAELDAIGPGWHPSWKVPGSTRPPLHVRFRSLVKRVTSPSP